MDVLVSTGWLADALGSADLRIVDATYFALEPGRDARAAYEAAHIPGALFMDLGSLADAASPLPSMLPDAATFAARMEALGIGDQDRIVLYDNSPQRTAARAWWMLRSFGATRVGLLDGGMAKWQAEGRPVATGTETTGAARFVARGDAAAVRTIAQMRDNVASGAEQVLDARGAARFTGEEADPRGLAPGHIPGSRNLPYGRMFEADGTWKSRDALRAEFERAGIDLAAPLVTTCGSGITAAVLLFAAGLIGKTDAALYDGSWSEWGALSDTAKATGAAA